MARFVLVHGAWHGGWSFAPLARELESRGHSVESPDLPCEDVSLAQHDYAERLGPCADAIVLGHSLAGLTISLVEARARVYLAAILPVENVYAESLAPGFTGLQRDELGRSFWPDIGTAAARLYPDCGRDTVEWAFPQLRRQAPLDPHVGSFGPTDVSVACLRDALVDPTWQLAAGRRTCGTVIELDAGHFAMLTHAERLADVLESIA